MLFRSEVGDDVAALVRARKRDRRNVGNVVETTVDDERRGGDTDARPDGEACRCASGQIRGETSYRADYSLISHQTGAMLIALSLQIIMLMKLRRHCPPIQKM